LAGAALAALVLVNLLLNLSLPTLLNGDSERLHVRFAWGWTVVPGRLHLRGLEVRGQGRADQWALTLARASGDVDLAALWHRTLRVDHLRATGASFRYRLRGSEASETVPTLPGLPDPPLPPLPPRARGQWTVELPEAVVHGVEEVWIEHHRLHGHAVAAGSLRLAEQVTFDAALQISDGRLLVGGQPAADTVTGRVTAACTGLPRSEPLSRASLGALSVGVALRAAAVDLGFLDLYLARTPWLTVGGPALLEVDAALDGGRLRSGSHLLARADALRVGFRSYDIAGRGVLWLGVDHDDPAARTRIAIQLGEYSIREDGDDEALVVGRGFQVLATSPDVALDRPLTSLRVVMDLPDSELPSAARLGDLLPRDVGLGLVGGSGRIRGHLEAEAGDEALATGDLHVQGRDLVLTWDALRVETDASLHARLSSGDLVTGAFDFSGSRLSLDRLGVREPGAEAHRGWWAEVEVPRGTVRVGAATRLDADLALQCADSEPIVALLAQRGDLAGWVQRLLSRPDVEGTARLVVGEDSLAVRGLQIEAGRSAELQLELHRARQTSRGALFAKLGPMSLGVEFHDDERRFHLLNARKWYERHARPD
jgi:hypothetical protein